MKQERQQLPADCNLENSAADPDPASPVPDLDDDLDAAPPDDIGLNGEQVLDILEHVLDILDILVDNGGDYPHPLPWWFWDYFMFFATK
jgi:hypothetical protein